MDIKGSVALVTGGNRGIGRAFARALIDHGAAKVYAGVRDPATVADRDITPLRLDVTKPEEIAAAAAVAGGAKVPVPGYPVPGPDRDRTHPVGDALETRVERIRHHLWRPVPGRRDLLTQPPETPLVG